MSHRQEPLFANPHFISEFPNHPRYSSQNAPENGDRDNEDSDD